MVNIRGFVVKPENATRKAEQYFFVNGRYMRHPYFLKAVQTAYSGLLTNDYQPSFFIYFDIDPEAIDVNIHPTKTEIKFADEQTIFQILMASVREALGKFSLAPTIDFETSGSLDIPIPTGKTVSRPQVTVDPTYNPFHTRGTIYPDRAPKNWESLFEGIQTPSGRDRVQNTEYRVQNTEFGVQPDLAPIDEENRPLWQYNGRYILMPSENGLVLINQHRAHVAVLHAQFMEQLNHSQGASQQLLFPEVIALSPDEMVLMGTLSEDLQSIGFDLQQLTPDSYSIQGVPAQMIDQSPVPVLQYILTQVRERGANTREEWRVQIAQTLSQNAAIPYGKTLTETEMRDLVTRLMALPNYRFTADGKTILSLMTDEEINKRF